MKHTGTVCRGELLAPFLWEKEENGGILLVGVKDRHLTDAVIPEGVTAVGNGAFSRCRFLLRVYLPASLLTLGADAFSRCDRLTEVNFSRGLVSVGNRAFAWCPQLRELRLPDGTGYVGHGAFYGCSRLTQVFLPAQVSYIGNRAFAWCAGQTGNLPGWLEAFPDNGVCTRIIYGGTETQWHSIEKHETWIWDSGRNALTCTAHEE